MRVWRLEEKGQKRISTFKPRQIKVWERLATLIELATGKSIDRPKILDMADPEDEDFEDDSEAWEDSDGITVIA